jgi:hypothetical protein
MEISFDVKSELFIEFSFTWFSLPLISINNIPMLVKSIWFLLSTNVSVFRINVALNFQYLSSFVCNVYILVSPELPPSWVSGSASYIIWSTIGLDIKWVALPVVVLESLWDLIEIPLLSSNILSPSLEPDIVGTVAFSNSLEWKSWSKVEWSIDVEAELLVESLGSNGISFIEIDNLPSLVGIVILISILVVNNNSLAFLVFTTSYIKDLVVSWVDKESSFESE